MRNPLSIRFWEWTCCGLMSCIDYMIDQPGQMVWRTMSCAGYSTWKGLNERLSPRSVLSVLRADFELISRVQMADRAETAVRLVAALAHLVPPKLGHDHQHHQARSLEVFLAGARLMSIITTTSPRKALPFRCFPNLSFLHGYKRRNYDVSLSIACGLYILPAKSPTFQI